MMVVSTFLFLSTVSIGWQIRNLAPILRAKLQSKIVENEGTNLLGKRMEVLDNVRILLMGYENIDRLPTCTFELTNLNTDRGFRFNDGALLLDETGGPLKLESVRAGQMDDGYYRAFQLADTSDAELQQSGSRLNRAPAIKLSFRDKTRIH
ncbi:hypothetical protein [Pseudomonas sp.]|uniref:hypothetical protein n=1 Tax=Pseudomonas sp. TaxID=306 RepID=UPI003C7104EA